MSTIKKHSLKFDYDSSGKGKLKWIDGDMLIAEYDARTGSNKLMPDNTIQLVNAIAPGIWWINTLPQATNEIGMFIEVGAGWKVRLKTPEKKEYSHFLIHPDGNKPGTDGCVGLIGTDAPELRIMIDDAIRHEKEIPFYINSPQPKPITEVEDMARYSVAKTVGKAMADLVKVAAASEGVLIATGNENEIKSQIATVAISFLFAALRAFGNWLKNRHK